MPTKRCRTDGAYGGAGAGDAVEGVHDAEVRGAGRGDDGEHLGAIGSAGDGLGNCIAPEPAIAVHPGEDDVDVHHASSGVDRRVGALGGDHGPACGPVEPCCSPLRVGVVAGGDQGRQVGHRPAGGEAAACRIGHLGQVGDPAECLILGEHHAGAVQPGRAAQRRGTDHEVEHGGRLGRRPRDEGEVAGVVGRDAGGGQVLGVSTQRLGSAESLWRDGLAHQGLEFGGTHRTVERRLVPDPLEGVAEHRLDQFLALPVELVHPRRSLGSHLPEARRSSPNPDRYDRRRRGCSSTARTSAFQADDEGSIPFTRSRSQGRRQNPSYPATGGHPRDCALLWVRARRPDHRLPRPLR
jgi:hypothetical protein